MTNLFTEHVDDLDKLLNELEDLARSNLPSFRFFATLVERLQLTISAESSVLLMPIDNGNWLPIAASGDVSRKSQDELFGRLTQLGVQASPEVLTGSHPEGAWIATPIRPRNFSKGCLLSCHQHALPPHAVAGLIELQTAFSEVVAIRQQAELEGFLDEAWDNAQALCLQIGTTKNVDELQAMLANGLAQVLEAARVSVVAVGSLRQPRLLAVSGVPQPNGQAPTVRSIQQLAREVLQTGKPVLRQQAAANSSDGEPLPGISPDGNFANLIATRLMGSAALSRQAGGQVSAPVIVIEYRSYSDMIHSATRLPQLLPTLAVAWEQRVRWLRLPRLARWFANSPTYALRAAIPLLKWPLLLLLVVAMMVVLQRPYPLVIEAEGAYEPVTSRAIYAADDGFVEELLIDDGSCVAAGDPLVQLRSPSLELRFEQIEGESRAVEEELRSIRIAINQLAADSGDALIDQSRLAGKIVELEIRQQSLREQRELLDEQRSGLLLKSPIEGCIVAKDLARHLAGRPVRRGDALFSVVQQSGPWHIRVNVADRDSGYVLKHFAVASDSEPQTTESSAEHSDADAADVGSESSVNFAFASDPGERFSAQLSWISDHVENRQGDGCFVEVRARVIGDRPVGPHAGAGVHAFFECGHQPLWFVWCRPLVEAAQRKLWFRSYRGDE